MATAWKKRIAAEPKNCFENVFGGKVLLEVAGELEVNRTRKVRIKAFYPSSFSTFINEFSWSRSFTGLNLPPVMVAKKKFGLLRRLDVFLELVVTHYFLKRFSSLRMWFLSRISKGNKCYNFPFIRNVQKLLDFFFFEAPYPA